MVSKNYIQRKNIKKEIEITVSKNVDITIEDIVNSREIVGSTTLNWFVKNISRMVCAYGETAPKDILDIVDSGPVNQKVAEEKRNASICTSWEKDSLERK